MPKGPMSQGVVKNGPSVPIADFQKICRENPEDIYVPNDVVLSARKDFRLQSSEDLKFFIGSGFENSEYINTEIWDNNPLKETHPSYVDAYSFTSGKKTGYIAYCPNPKMKNWRLKSFKENIVGAGAPVNSLVEAFANAGLLVERKKEKK